MAHPARRPAVARHLLAAVWACLGALALAVPVAAGPASAAAGPAAGARAASGSTICVGLVVDGTAAGGSRSTGCAKVPAGSSGIDVLEAAGHSVSTRDNGDFVCSIDGVPASGCSGIDDSHYWAYWHRAAGAGGWTYSTEGAGSYRPGAGSTEGWVYDAGSSRKPGTVGQLCPTARQNGHPATPAPTRSSAAGRKPTAATRPVSGGHRQRHEGATAPSGSAAATPGARAGTNTGGRHRSSPPQARHRRSPRDAHSPRSAAPATAAATATGEGTAATPAAATARVKPAGGGHAGPWLVVVALLAVAALSAGAWWRSRRTSP